MITDQEYLNSTQAVVDLKGLNARFIQNFVTNDVASHDAILHPAFVVIQRGGQYMNRTAYLEQWGRQFDPNVVVYWDVRDERITVVGDMALVRSTNKYTFVRGASETTGMTTYTDTYVYCAGRWLCVQAQITPVLQEFEPGDDTIVSVYIRGVKQER